MKNILITGAAGFIAPHIIEACTNRGWQVWGIDIIERIDENKFDHDNFKFENKDVRDLTKNDLESIDYIIHLAFVTNIPNSIQHPLDTTRDNIDMTVYLLNLAKRQGSKKYFCVNRVVIWKQ